MSAWLRSLIAVCGCAAAGLLAGCSGAERVPPLHPVTGTLAREGKSVGVGGLLFVPEPATNTPFTVNAPVQPDGTFAAQTLWTARDGKSETRPGAPAGRYRVVYHPPSDGSKSGLEVDLPDVVTVEPNTAALRLALPAELPGGQGMERDDVPKK
ncbi:hypothetical protein R5W24_002656 [Gemmata sp. JC717]|uniref:hypothetical protein n=1 Tax=Gemmata algarum TaxID=2975278 RepID=UPI0021BB05D4|nr:hypothetical protein [Gemmata algarum]MDY3553553.1 hypothetical protein [Gemmata algarum]